MKKVVVFGIGKQYRHLKNAIADEYVVVALSDNDEKKQGLIMDGVPVICPCCISELDYDIILITLKEKALADVTEQLKQVGIPLDKIRAYDKTISPFVIDALFFKKQLSDNEKKTLFKNNVELVSIEFNSSCNRKCWMCTNSILDRHSNDFKLNRDVAIKVLSELNEINYEGDISLSLFNEPMIDKNLDENIKTIKSYLPNAPVHFNTNGDYLTQERLTELEVLGLDFLPVSLYIDKVEKPWTYEDSVLAIQAKATHLGLEIESLSSENNIITNARCKYKSLWVLFRCANHRIVAGDRCGSIPDDAPVKRFKEANRICDRFFTQFGINYTGEVTACPNFHPNFPAHKEYIVGNLKSESIFDVFANDRWTQLRKTHIFDVSKQPCNACGIISDVWGDASISIIPSIQPFRDRPRYRREL